ncbi:GATA transcription factor 12 [Acorus gramineus]|uniref:GATA transcription factor n=1 Tax=Acorus gramineus TaxID=55184 RepID=A0AAV9AKM6_ACOGR|nr:GATA transcription factor 12 [Acorus gramineus]
MEVSEFDHGDVQFTPERRCSSYYSPTPFDARSSAAAGAELFIVDDLLDFSNNDDGDDDEGEGSSSAVPDGTAAEAPAVAGDYSAGSNVESCNSPLSDGNDRRSSGGEFGISGELCVPYEELAELEWLSNFVEESFSTEDLQNLHLISGIASSSGTAASIDGPVPSPHPPPSISPTEIPSVPGKSRTKRSRSSAAAHSSWSSSSRLSPTTTTSAASSPKKREAASTEGRKCRHCLTEKTPQWRTGPMGPKTLCNACGVRYKSGRLVPEYRPAASPTFVLSKHSNSHRKVLELRRQKEEEELCQNGHHNQFLHRLAIYEAGGDGGGGPEFRRMI